MDSSRPESLETEIAELEALITLCQHAGDPESLWIQRLLLDALAAKRLGRTPLPARSAPFQSRQNSRFTHKREGNCVRIRPWRKCRNNSGVTTMYFEWTDNLDTGIPDIDHQHQRIAEYINALHEAQQTNNRAGVGDVLGGLIDYTIDHFSFEEQLMEKAGYRYLSAHQRVHELFGKRVAEYRGRFAKGEEITDELLEMLKYWLAHHIETEDRAYLSSVQEVLADDSKKGWMAGLVQKIFG